MFWIMYLFISRLSDTFVESLFRDDKFHVFKSILMSKNTQNSEPWAKKTFLVILWIGQITNQLNDTQMTIFGKDFLKITQKLISKYR